MTAMTLEEEVATRLHYIGSSLGPEATDKNSATYEFRCARLFLNIARPLRDKEERTYFARVARVHHRIARYYQHRQSS